jgi:hypothetical protein
MARATIIAPAKAVSPRLIDRMRIDIVFAPCPWHPKAITTHWLALSLGR